MFRSLFSLLAFLYLFTACSTTDAVPIYVAPAHPPNVLLIVADDLGWADLNCYGNPLVESPHLDDLARNGVQFMQAYATASTGTATRASIQTGLYPARMDRLLEPRHRTLAELAKAASYYTAHFGKWDCGPNASDPGNQGYTASFRDSSSADRLTDRALSLLQQLGDTSWLISINYFEPKLPLQPRPDQLQFYQDLVNRTHYRPYPALPYAAVVSTLDENVGKLVEQLRRGGQLEKTLIVFVSDNGGLDSTATTDNGILRGGKGELTEGGIRVPFILSYPEGIEQRKAITDPVSVLDIFPTVAAAIGITGDTPDGVSLFPLVNGERPPRRNLYWYQPTGEYPAAAVRNDRWKLLHNLRTDSITYHDLKRFPDELHGTENAPDRDLAGALEEWKRSMGNR